MHHKNDLGLAAGGLSSTHPVVASGDGPFLEEDMKTASLNPGYKGYFSAPNGVFDIGLSSGAIALLLFLYRYCGQDGGGFPSPESLQRAMSSSAAGVALGLRELEEYGALVVIRTSNEITGAVHNEYILAPL